MDYLELMKRQPDGREALVEDGVSFTYGDLIFMAQEKAGEWEAKRTILPGSVRIIKERRILFQLVSFFACFLTGEIPLVVPWDSRCFHRDHHLMEGEVPKQACIAVATSGTNGQPKIYFRTYESWAGYFPIQNEIFDIHRDSRLLVQGSLSFTGNMNLYLALFSVGAAVIAENEFQPGNWEARMEQQGVNAIYLIPSKLLLLPKLMQRGRPEIKVIISGSQSLGRADADRLKSVFPDARVVLYYGATELNYITYVTDDMMTEQRNLIGKPFPQVDVYVEGEEIFVNTPYHVEGITCPCTLSDKGTMDEAGNLYFHGRTDDILLFRGNKISAVKVENVLEGIQGVEEAAVCMGKAPRWRNEQIVAYVVTCQYSNVKEQDILAEAKNRLQRWELPRRIYFLNSLPKNASGKVDKKQLYVLK